MITFTKSMLTGAVAATAMMAATMASAETLTMSSWVPPTHFVHTDFLVPFTEKVAEATEGRVNVVILPAPLASPPQHWELARNGVADITWGNFTYEPERFVSMWFAEFPNAGTNAEAQSRALWQTYEAYLADNAAFAGVKMLAVGMFGGGQLHHGSKTVTSPEDVANVKFRMGGPIQEKLLTSLGAVPVAAPATKAYEMLESGVIDGSLHTMESVVNFRLEDSLEHHTIFPNGFYDATFFVIMNGAKWDGLADQDKAAIEGIIGEELSAAWGKNFDLQNPAATEKLGAAGHEIVEASPELIAAVDTIYDTMVADWVEAAKAAGVADPQAMLTFYNDTYEALATESAASASN
ncbi:TRAP transporter substrate-binding protein [Ruegeria pomeroyi]|uniref:TRAP transporter substrate-binding protein n=1 Tax=Ruegeria alba TaxID=2916756 RepID=A0ABS9P1V6_9RHOB|nr:TRAP transporter substrate-binding protein [Ruegeria alba]MCE8512661.1 TRAP transporter substrate-binding protein [Ruegeria pomeroyi]MCE8531274.1 TRAP transporter substrate-binding protein [Ruegeria pomeroyi]MCG6560448.1 TRAP transporter substrate-binding protein [Ruegeria alba]